MKTEHVVAVPDVCAWPNLTLLPDRTIIAAIWNQPCHGHWEGDLDCWGSEDDGVSWHFRGRIAEHEPGANRMNCAAGLDANRDLIVAVSGWSNREAPGNKNGFDEATVLRAWVCRSADSGRSWLKIGELPESGEYSEYIPFGDFQVADDGALCVSVYMRTNEPKSRSACLLRSYDDGVTWSTPHLISSSGSETAMLHLGDGKWLAASRHMDGYIESFHSQDDGRTWSYGETLTKPREITGHLLRVQDGRILLSYGNRIEGECGVDARWSEDEGQSWGVPFRLAYMPAPDGGYPSSVQRSDGQIVTAYYSQHPNRGENQYEMNVVIWHPDEGK